MSIVSIKNVSVFQPNSNHLHLVESVSCDINAGEVLAIVGPNGAGKSSLLKAITGEWNYEGTIDLIGISSKPKLRARQLSVLPQSSLLSFPYTVSDVVLLGRIPHQTGSVRDQEIAREALEIMDVDFLANRIYTELSGGEKQRVQLARVLAQIWSEQDAENGARLLILDEPTTALDIGHQHALMNAVKAFAKQGVAVAVVLHDINLATQYADKILALLCSQTIAYGPPSEVITTQNMHRLFSIDVDVVKHPSNGTPMVVTK